MVYVLFDLDGTLSDSQEGIINSFIHTLEALGITVPERSELLQFIGPPLKDSFKEAFKMSEEEAEGALEIFRSRYDTKGKYENILYAGIKELLEMLVKRGYLVGLATSKPELIALDILEHFDIRKYFQVVVGASADDSFSKKKDILEKAIALGSRRSEPLTSIFMVGDRCYDMEAAKTLGVKAIGVTYGFGTEEELLATGANYIAHNPQEILKIIDKQCEE